MGNMGAGEESYGRLLPLHMEIECGVIGGQQSW